MEAGEGLSPLDRGELANRLLADVNQQFDSLKRDILDLELLQARIRSESLTLTPVELPWQSAVEISYRYRLDLMNARASLVDQWRLIEYNADNLESTLDLVFSGDITNDLNESRLQKSVNTGQIKAGLRFDAPIVRLSERNTYRQTLLEYQQAKRNFYAGLDDIARSLRQTLRTMQTNRLNFELQRLAVSVAARQNNYNNEILQLTQSGGATAARDTVSALSDLLNAQNNFLSIWVNYEVLRRSLDLDLGTMLMDEEGMWIDPGAIGPDHLERMQNAINYDPIDAWESWSDGVTGKPGAMDADNPPRPVVEPDDQAGDDRNGPRMSASPSRATPPGADRRGAHLASPLAAAPAQPLAPANLANQRGESAAAWMGPRTAGSSNSTSLWGGISDSFAGLFSSGPVTVEVPRPNLAPTRGMPLSAATSSAMTPSTMTWSAMTWSAPSPAVASRPGIAHTASAHAARVTDARVTEANGATGSHAVRGNGPGETDPTRPPQTISKAGAPRTTPSLGGSFESRLPSGSAPAVGGPRPNVPRTVPPSNRVAEEAVNEEAEGVRLASHLEAASPRAATSAASAASAAVAARTALPSKLPTAPTSAGSPAKSASPPPSSASPSTLSVSAPKSSRRRAAGQGPVAGAIEDPNREK